MDQYSVTKSLYIRPIDVPLIALVTANAVLNCSFCFFFEGVFTSVAINSINKA